MKLKKLIALAMGTVMVAGMVTGCGEEANNTASKSDGETYEIGVIQLVEHEALDEANKGFVDGLEEEGLNVNIDQKNAQGEQSTCDTISEKFVSDGKDLVLAIATPAAQAIAGKTTDIPILVTAVTDPKEAGLVNSNELPGTNVSGTSDLTPVEQQMNLLHTLLPDAKTVGLLYCSAEDNSLFQIELAEKVLDEMGIGYKRYTVSSTNEIQTVVESMVGDVDVIYTPTDNMVASGMSTVSMVATENKIPIICGEKNMVDNGGLATYGIDYYELGKMTAKMAVRILKNGENPADMAIEYLPEEYCELSVNEEVAAELGIDLSVLNLEDSADDASEESTEAADAEDTSAADENSADDAAEETSLEAAE